MADISKIQLPNGNEYDLKDTVARVTIPYGAVDSTSTSTAFTATVDGITELKDGVCVYLDNNVVASASGWTLNINGLGAKPVYFSSSDTRTTTHFGVAVTALFVYNSSHVTGGCWDWVVGYDSNTNTLPTVIYHYNNIKAKAAIAAESLIVGDSSGYQKVGSGITFDITYPLVWCTAALAANAQNYSNVFLQQYDRNLQTGVKSGYISSANKVQYLVTTVSGITATIDSSIITDTLPSTDDGKVYIELGKLGAQSTGANYFILYPSHHFWWYKNGKVRPYGDYGHSIGADVPSNAVFTDTKNTAGSTDSSKKLFLIGAETQAANPQTYSQDTAYIGTDGKLYSNSKVVLTGGSNASSTVTITPSTTDVYSMTSAGSVTAGTKNVPTRIDTTKFSGGSFTRGTFSQGTLPTLTFAMDTTDTKKLKITFGQGTLPTHAADSFTAAALQSGFYTAGTANTPTAVTLPGRSSTAIKAWTGYTAATAAAQTFTGSSS